MTDADRRCMARALQLAGQGLFTTDPNPCVGCIIVDSYGDIIAEGWHRFAGKAHAEIEALKTLSMPLASGCTAYVSLEPCCHFGKTGPCTQALIAAKVSRVVIAMLDPNPQVAGKGLKELQAAGIQTEVGLLQEQAEAINPGFVKRMRQGRPLVRIKMAMSLDGRTATKSGESQWITAPAARADVHKLRARSSAILTGIGTILQDDPSLTVRLDDDIDVLQPLRVIVDSALHTPLTAKILSPASQVVIYTCSQDDDKRMALESAGAKVHRVSDTDRRTDLVQVLSHLAEHYQVNELMIEAGAILAGAFVTAGIADHVLFYIAPSLLGHEAKAALHLPGIDAMQNKVQLKNIQTRMVGSDIRISAEFDNVS